MHKVKTETIPAVFLLKFQKPTHSNPTNFLKLNCMKPTPQLSRSKDRISVIGPAFWNEFLTDSEKESENVLV